MEDLERNIKIKNKYLELMIDIGYDYDGYEKPESLKSLIDDLLDLARKALKNDDKSVLYEGFENVKYNILMEEIK